ncbi:NAD-binding protein [Natronomonas sp. F2-12]|jgi:trk system potassium uptake protein TrkA|uniref:NAD-binding protein n=1 Tax=Natronomonas aquatica TaxID=2841590 RepID=A0A9R1D6L1_9EURY|nr:NAD(P)-binding protein [Natronomonas aquatica]MCQ4333568.1 NAD-binding protein [Natronomonas aquatica]
MRKDVLVVGAGRVGYRVAERLGSQGHTVTVVEQDAARCDEISPRVDQVIQADGTDPAILKKTDIETFDTVAALTDDITANLTICETVHEQASEARTVLRIEEDGQQDYGYRSFVDHVVYPAAAGADIATEKIIKA